MSDVTLAGLPAEDHEPRGHAATQSLHRFCSTADGRGHPDPRQDDIAGRDGEAPREGASAARHAREPASPRILPALGAGWRWLKAANARLEASWVGDLIGVILLALLGYGLIVIAGVLA